MDLETLKLKVKKIVEHATTLKNKHVDINDTPVNYACIFSHNQEEYDELVETVEKIGKVVKETPTGLLFYINPLNTVSGVLKLLKIRLPDPTRPELGDADFTIMPFLQFKKEYLSKKGFKLIKRENFEMIELMDPSFNVRAYFSDPPLDKQLGIIAGKSRA